MNELTRQIVVKVGGSLLDWPLFPDRLYRFLESHCDPDDHVLLIAGGGVAADWVRHLDRVHSLGEESSHKLAVRSLDFTARIVEALVAGTKVVESLEGIKDVWQSGGVPVLAPRAVLDDDDLNSTAPLPRNWNTTTDSIAARIASLLNADELVLLKSADVPREISAEQLADLGLVDAMFPEACRGLGCVSVVNLRAEHVTPVRLTR